MRGRFGARVGTVRRRVMTLMLGFMVASLLGAGAVTFAVQLADLNQRVDAELIRHVDELQQLAVAGPSGGDDTPYTDLDALFFDYLQSTVPSEHESMVTLIDGAVVYVSGGDRAFDITSLAVQQATERVGTPGRAVTTEVHTPTTDLRLVVADVSLEGDSASGTLVVGADIGSQRADVRRAMTTYAAVALAATALAAVVGTVLAGRLLRPVRDLRAATADISLEDLTRRVEVSGADTDVAQVATAFNQMLDRLQAGFAEQRQFLDDAAHELRTPLTIVRGHIELLDAQDPADVAGTQALVLEETDRMQRLVDDLLLLARARRPDFVRVGPVSVEQLGEELRDRAFVLGDRDWRSDLAASGTVLVDHDRVLQAGVQLLANAARFTTAADSVTVATRWETEPPIGGAGELDPAARYLVITVRDTGAGIEQSQHELVFERFARAAGTEHADGSGLGLPIVAAIAQAHGGAVTLDSAPGVGSAFAIWIPDRDGMSA